MAASTAPSILDTVPPAPPCLPPVTDKLPWQSDKMQAEAGYHLAHYHRWETEVKSRKKLSKGLFGVLEAGLDNLGAAAEVGIVGLSGDLQIARAKEEQEKAHSRFRLYFPLIAHEKFWQAYDCHLVNQKVNETGEVYITDQSLSFSTEDSDKRRVVKFSIPLRQILCIRRAVIRTKAAHKEEAPILYTINELEVSPRKHHHHHHDKEPDGYQIFTADNRVHIFFDFVATLGSHFYNALDHAWRACVASAPPQATYYAAPPPPHQFAPPPRPPPQADVAPLVPESHKPQVLLSSDSHLESPQLQQQQPQQQQYANNPFNQSDFVKGPPAATYVDPQPVSYYGNVATPTAVPGYAGSLHEPTAYATPVPVDYMSHSGPPPPVPSRQSRVTDGSGASPPPPPAGAPPALQNPYGAAPAPAQPATPQQLQNPYVNSNVH